jgi:hypothetical protein
MPSQIGQAALPAPGKRHPSKNQKSVTQNDCEENFSVS